MSWFIGDKLPLSLQIPLSNNRKDKQTNKKPSEQLLLFSSHLLHFSAYTPPTKLCIFYSTEKIQVAKTRNSSNSYHRGISLYPFSAHHLSSCKLKTYCFSYFKGKLLHCICRSHSHLSPERDWTIHYFLFHLSDFFPSEKQAVLHILLCIWSIFTATFYSFPSWNKTKQNKTKPWIKVVTALMSFIP